MALRVCVLGSGSAGNCSWVDSDHTAILVDAGLSARETVRRLEGIGVAPETIAAVCLTHEHTDHTAGLTALHQRRRLPVFANAGTIEGLQLRNGCRNVTWNIFTTGVPFRIGDLVVEPFSVPHDAYDPVGFVISASEARVGIVTDMGTVTALIRERLRACRAIIIEANHDETLLRQAERPWHLKQRIIGRQGHLSNEHAAELVCELAGGELSVVYLAHLSRECNRPELALEATLGRLRERGIASVSVRLTQPHQASEIWISA